MTTHNLFYRLNNFDAKLSVSEKILSCLAQFLAKFKISPEMIYVNGIYEQEIGNSLSDIPVGYKSTLGLYEFDFAFPDGFVPSQSV